MIDIYTTSKHSTLQPAYRCRLCCSAVRMFLRRGDEDGVRYAEAHFSAALDYRGRVKRRVPKLDAEINEVRVLLALHGSLVI